MNNTTNFLCVLKSASLVRERVQAGATISGFASGIGRDQQAHGLDRGLALGLGCGPALGLGCGLGGRFMATMPVADLVDRRRD